MQNKREAHSDYKGNKENAKSEKEGMKQITAKKRNFPPIMTGKIENETYRDTDLYKRKESPIIH